MKITWSIHLYPPKHNCGSEWMAHNINKFLVSRGHEVRVILHQAAKYNIRVPYSIDGVDVSGPTHKIEQYQWPDVLLTHLEYTSHTLPLGRLAKKPVIQFVHGNARYSSIENAKHARVVYNSQWIADELNYKWKSIVFNPFCDYNFINVNKNNPISNEYIALVNLNENKGGKIFYDIARAMPDRKFLGIKGGYDHQIIENLPNVTIVENAKDIREYYRQIRLVLMPSEYESWGMVATESMANGIPVICTETPGLIENCGSAGIFVTERENIQSWVGLIEMFDDAEMYFVVSSGCRDRARELCNPERLFQLENFLYESLQDYRRS